MADFTALKTAIQTYIKQNGNEEITGNILQEVLLAMVQTMGDGAINDLVTALSNEVTARQNADGTLQNNIAAEALARGNADTALGNRLTAAEGAITTINTMLVEGYVYAGIATTSTNPGTPNGKVFYIAVSSGTYTNFSNLTVAQGINILKYNGSAWSKDIVYVVDERPKKASQNLVTSGGVFDNMGALDVSELNATENPHTLAQYIDLSAALAAIPTDYQKGGMSIKFVQSSDNKYVQYRLMAQSFTTDVSKWQGVDSMPYVGSANIPNSGGVAEYSLMGDSFPSKSEVSSTVNEFTFSASEGLIKNSTDFGSVTFACLKGEAYIFAGFATHNQDGGLFTDVSPVLGDTGTYIKAVNGIIKAYKDGYVTIRLYKPSTIDNTIINRTPKIYKLGVGNSFYSSNAFMQELYGKNIASMYDFLTGYYFNASQEMTVGGSWNCAIINLKQSYWLNKFIIDGVGNSGAVTSFRMNDNSILKLTNNGNPGDRLELVIPEGATQLYYSCSASVTPYFEVLNCFNETPLTVDNCRDIIREKIDFIPENPTYGYYSFADETKVVHENPNWIAVKLDVAAYRGKLIHLSAIRRTSAANSFYELSDGTYSASPLGTSSVAPYEGQIPNNAVYLYASINAIVVEYPPHIYIEDQYANVIQTDEYPQKNSKRPIGSGAVYNALEDIANNAKTETFNLVKRKSVVSFIFDDNNDGDVNFKQYCDDKGVKCGFAVISVSSRYVDYYNAGFSILAHGNLPSGGWTEANLRSLIETKLTALKNAGINCKGWVTPSSNLTPTELRPIVYDYFEYGYTIGNDQEQEPHATYITYNSKTYLLWRNNMDSLTEEQCKAIIDDAVTNNAMVCFYSHTNMTEAKFKAIVDYAIAHSQVMAPDDAARYFFAARHNEDLT